MRANYSSRFWTGVAIAGLTLSCLLGDSVVVVGFKKLTETSPQINIQRWLEIGEFDWQDPPIWGSNHDLNTDLISVNDTTFIFSQYIGAAIISCEASYPVQWTSNLGQRFPPSYLLKGRSSRHSEDIFDKSTFTYFSNLLFQQGHLTAFTGNYTCHKVGDPSLSSNVYMFWEGLPPPYLVLAGRSVTFELTGDEDTLELPCLTSVPDVEVFLFKAFFDMYYVEHFQEIRINSSVQFDSKIGYILNLKELQFPLGKYKCDTNSTGDSIEILIKNLEPGSGHGHEGNGKAEKTALFSYDPTNMSLICCSSGKSAPIIKAELCLGPTICQIRGPQLKYTLDESRTDKLISTRIVRPTTENNCTYGQMLPGVIGRFQCVGEGINVIRTLYSSYSWEKNNFIIYQSWKDINATDLIHINVNEIDYPPQFYVRYYNKAIKKTRKGFFIGKVNWNKLHQNKFFRPDHGKLPDTIFAGESINFTCSVNANHFASGAKFVVRWKNSTLEQVALNEKRLLVDLDPRIRVKIFTFSFHQNAKSTVSVRMDTEMTAIICYAPVYNSSEWVQKELALHVQAPTLPTIIGGTEDEVVYWTLNDTNKILKCEATGEPQPTLMFQLNGKEVVNGTLTMTNNTVNGSLVIRIPEVAYETHGDYYCIASNLAGVTQKKIVIIVQQPTHWASIISVTVVSVALLIVLVLTAWKFQLQKKILAKLRGNASLM